MPASTKVTQSRLQRLRAVEEMYLGGYCAIEIFELIGETYGVTRGTIRNDISAIRKIWGEDLSNRDRLEGQQRYMASLRSMRRRALKGWTEVDAQGATKIRGRDYKLAHQLDKEIARLSGVELASDTKKVHVDIQAAREFMDRVMEIIFGVVTDREQQEAIIKALEADGEGGA